MNYNSVTGKNWKLNSANNNEISKNCEIFSISPILSKLLTLRKIPNNKIKEFLSPHIKNISLDPYKITDMKSAVDFIFECIKNKSTIGIFGDYDVDGASSVALLIKFFNNIKHPYKFFIPDRQNDGYGPSINTFNKFIKKNIKIIITVDCGTMSYDAIEHANKHNVKIVIIDHHQGDLIIPKAFAVVNPNRLDDRSNLNYLCAAAVVFLFLYALDKKMQKINWYKNNKILPSNLFENLDLVALATICDVVPLINLNRYFVKYGLKQISLRKNLGLKILSDVSKIKTSPSTYELGFIFGPKINAGGRLGHSNYGTKLLSTNDHDEANFLSYKLTSLNEKRKKFEDISLSKIIKEAEFQKKDPIIVLYNKDLHEGVLGILASRIKDKFYKPTFILSGLKNNIKASARSTYGFDIGKAILNLMKQKIILSGGGHKMAGGFTIEKKKIHLLKKIITDIFLKNNKNDYIFNEIYADAIILPTAVNEKFYDDINLMSPFGAGNKEPFFIIENLKIFKFKIIQNKHVSLILISKDKKIINCISFNAINSELHNYLLNYKKPIDIIGKLSSTHWKNKKKIQFVISDVSTR